MGVAIREQKEGSTWWCKCSVLWLYRCLNSGCDAILQIQGAFIGKLGKDVQDSSAALITNVCASRFISELKDKNAKCQLEKQKKK